MSEETSERQAWAIPPILPAGHVGDRIVHFSVVDQERTRRQLDRLQSAIQSDITAWFGNRTVGYRSVANMKHAVWEIEKYPEWGRGLPPGGRPSWKRGTWA